MKLENAENETKLKFTNLKLKFPKVNNYNSDSGIRKDLNQGDLKSFRNLGNLKIFKLSNSKLDLITKKPKIRNNSNTNISTINSSIMIRQDKKKHFNFDSEKEITMNPKSLGTQFQLYSKFLKASKYSNNQTQIPLIESNAIKSSSNRKNLMSNSKVNESKNKNLSNLFMTSIDKKIYLTKTLKKNKDLSEDLNKLNKITEFDFEKEKPIILKHRYCNSDLKLLNENPKYSNGNITSFSTRCAPIFKDQISMNEYLIKNFNIGSQNVKYFNSKKRIKLIAKFYESRKEKKLKSNICINKKSLSLSNEKNNLNTDNFNFDDIRENFRGRQIKFGNERLSRTINIANIYDKSPNLERLEKFMNGNNFLENKIISSPDKNRKLQKILNFDTNSNKEQVMQYKNQKNVFRMRASHILSLHNDLVEDDKISSLNIVKVPHLKNKKLKEFLQKIKKAPAEINPKFRNVAESNFIDNFKKYKKDLDNQILDTILAQKKMPAQSYLKMKFKKSTLEKFRQYEAKLDPHVLK